MRSTGDEVRAGSKPGVDAGRRRTASDAGFTLVEMVVACGVVLLMVAAALIAAPGILQQARQGMCDATGDSIQNAISASYTGNGHYSGTGANDLVADGYLIAVPDPSAFTIGTANADGVTVTFGEQCSDEFVAAIWAGYVADGEYVFGDGGVPATFAPSATTNLIGTPGDTEVELSWTAPADDGGSPLTGYSVLVSESEDAGFMAAQGCTGLDGSTPTCTATGLTNGTLYYFRVAAVNAVGTGDYAANSFMPVEPAACDEGGECALGEEGPGGGMVFYDAGTNESWGRYLEVAPADWSGGLDPVMNAGCQTGVDSNMGTATAVGTGKANTDILVAASQVGEACAASPADAAIAADNYTGGAETDWYLPSRDELNQLCRWAAGQSTGPAVTGSACSGFSGTSTNGGFVQDVEAPWTGYYTSSLITTVVYLEYLATGEMLQMSRTYGARVRPIRAFSPTP